MLQQHPAPQTKASWQGIGFVFRKTEGLFSSVACAVLCSDSLLRPVSPTVPVPGASRESDHGVSPGRQAEKTRSPDTKTRPAEERGGSSLGDNGLLERSDGAPGWSTAGRTATGGTS